MRPLEQRRRAPKGGRRAVQQLKSLAAALREADSAQRDPKRTWRSEHLHVGEFCLRHVACALALPKSQQRLGGARAGMQITHVSNFSAPHIEAKHCSTILEVDERLRGSVLCEPEPSVRGRDQYCADARRPPFCGRSDKSASASLSSPASTAISAKTVTANASPVENHSPAGRVRRLLRRRPLPEALRGVA